MAYWKLAGPGVGQVVRVGSTPRVPLGPLLGTLCFSGWALGDELAQGEPLAPWERGDSVSFGSPVVTSVVTPLGHPRVGRVPCSVLCPGLCPHPMSSLLSCWGLREGTGTPRHRAPPALHRAAPTRCHATVPMPRGFPWSMKML